MDLRSMKKSSGKLGLPPGTLVHIGEKKTEIVKIQLMFIAGIYGMNFENMPELKLSWGYFGVWGMIGTVGILMVVFFKGKGWL